MHGALGLGRRQGRLFDFGRWRRRGRLAAQDFVPLAGSLGEFVVVGGAPVRG